MVGLSGGGETGKGVIIGSCFFFVNCLSNSLFVVRRLFLVSTAGAFQAAGAQVPCGHRHSVVVLHLLCAGDDGRWWHVLESLRQSGVSCRQAGGVGDSCDGSVVSHVLRADSLDYHVLPDGGWSDSM